MTVRTGSLVIAAFATGTLVGVAAAPKKTIDPVLYKGKTPQEAAAALLPLAKESAEGGSWENIFVGRVHYLSGSKEEGQKIFDAVTSSRKVEGGDWFRIGKVYFEAGEWDKAKAAFDKVLQMNPDDEDWIAEIGAYYNLKGDRAKAEELFAKTFKIQSNNVWNTAKVAGSYVGVVPQ
jgi:tetratricopeptide (TPR) repeat protein